MKEQIGETAGRVWQALSEHGELQEDVDTWLSEYNEQRPHSGKYCFGKTPMQTLIDSIPLTREKMVG